eukprot:maker-scaffold_1-snap-gene-8.5-mRNA-1 protein AED:0.00 eAED:0.00 QI:14/1/1/1/1/1/2/71/378
MKAEIPVDEYYLHLSDVFYLISLCLIMVEHRVASKNGKKLPINLPSALFLLLSAGTIFLKVFHPQAEHSKGIFEVVENFVHLHERMSKTPRGSFINLLVYMITASELGYEMLFSIFHLAFSIGLFLSLIREAVANYSKVSFKWSSWYVAVPLIGFYIFKSKEQTLVQMLESYDIRFGLFQTLFILETAQFGRSFTYSGTLYYARLCQFIALIFAGSVFCFGKNEFTASFEFMQDYSAIDFKLLFPFISLLGVVSSEISSSKNTSEASSQILVYTVFSAIIYQCFVILEERKTFSLKGVFLLEDYDQQFQFLQLKIFHFFAMEAEAHTVFSLVNTVMFCLSVVLCLLGSFFSALGAGMTINLFRLLQIKTFEYISKQIQ